jgi:uncharacterized damage-inducible protein DinB
MVLEVHGDRAQVLLGYLDHFRAVLLRSLEGLTEEQLTSSSLPSGWTPLGLLKHLVCTEERWLVWRFEGTDLANPFADLGDAGWDAGPDDTLPVLTQALHDQAARTRTLLESTDLDATGRPSDRWRGGEPATLERLLLHLLQEHARHAGHLDVVVELLGD